MQEEARDNDQRRAEGVRPRGGKDDAREVGHSPHFESSAETNYDVTDWVKKVVAGKWLGTGQASKLSFAVRISAAIVLLCAWKATFPAFAICAEL